MNILVVGSINMDIILTVPQIPKPGETMLGYSINYSPGGKGANQAYAAAKLGANVTFLGGIGDDEFGQLLQKNLSDVNVDIGHVTRDRKQHSGMAAVTVDDKGNNSIVVISGANNSCSKEYLIENDECFKRADAVLFQLEIPMSSVVYGVKRAKQLGKTVILNPAPAPKQIPQDLLQNVDFLTPNEHELKVLAGIPGEEGEDIKLCAKKLVQRGVKNVITTLGGRGAFLLNESEEKAYPAFKTEVVDTTAAGDCFNAAFVTALIEGKEIDDAIIFANGCAAVAVSKNGAQSSMPSLYEVESFLKHGKLCKNN